MSHYQTICEFSRNLLKHSVIKHTIFRFLSALQLRQGCRVNCIHVYLYASSTERKGLDLLHRRADFSVDFNVIMLLTWQLITALVAPLLLQWWFLCMLCQHINLSQLDSIVPGVTSDSPKLNKKRTNFIQQTFKPTEECLIFKRWIRGCVSLSKMAFDKSKHLQWYCKHKSVW